MQRICPYPRVWHEAVERLKREARLGGVSGEPPTPLILGGWTYSNDLEKKARWEATVRWADEHGLLSALPTRDEDFYAVERAFGGMVGPAGGPMYLPWRFEAVRRPAKDELEQALVYLQRLWRSLEPSQVTALTRPLRFTGRKARRLEILVEDSSIAPPWGTWTSLASGPQRRAFTEFRRSINECLSPHEVDHVDFVPAAAPA